MRDNLSINIKENNCEAKLNRHLGKLIKSKTKEKDYDNITIVCIGTDRSAGDALGPIAGKLLKEKLSKKRTKKNVHIIGDLENPVHAKNIHERLEEIPENSLVIGIDACLGSIGSIENIEISNKCLHPGAAMGKGLPAVGDISIKGIVNISGGMEFIVLQNTRLYVVHKLAEHISNVIDKTVLSKKIV